MRAAQFMASHRIILHRIFLILSCSPIPAYSSLSFCPSALFPPPSRSYVAVRPPLCATIRPAICGLHLFLRPRLLRHSDLWLVLLTAIRGMVVFVPTSLVGVRISSFRLLVPPSPDSPGSSYPIFSAARRCLVLVPPFSPRSSRTDPQDRTNFHEIT